eukprot:COSAG02_NODE_7448_length_3009_cov_2.048454_4_plen_129_part_00
MRNSNFKTVWCCVRHEIDYACSCCKILRADGLGNDGQRSWISHLEVDADIASRAACGRYNTSTEPSGSSRPGIGCSRRVESCTGIQYYFPSFEWGSGGDRVGIGWSSTGFQHYIGRGSDPPLGPPESV